MIFKPHIKWRLDCINRYLREAVAMIDANLPEPAIELLNGIISLNPQNYEAEKMLLATKTKLISNQTDKLLTHSQVFIKNNNRIKAYETVLKAYLINPKRVISILDEYYDDKNNDIKLLKDNEVKKQENLFEKALTAGDFENIALIRNRLAGLAKSRKYDKRIMQAKIEIAERYLK